MNPSSIKSARAKRVLVVVALLFACVLPIGSSAQSTSQQQQPNSKPWEELVSAEGRFTVLMPGTAEERFAPIPGQILTTEVHGYFVKTDVAMYAVVYSDLAEADQDLLKTIFDSGPDEIVARLSQSLGTNSVRLVSEKDISSGTTMGRECVVDAGAHLIKDRIYYRNKRLYQVVFGAPRVDGMSPELVKFYDGLSSKFFGSFKIKT